KYPSDWIVFDALNKNNICCVFISNYQESATTTFDAPGRIKMQIGTYETGTFDPFKLGTTTKITLGKNVAYKGTSGGMTFYILPLSAKSGFGVAVFAPQTQPQVANKAVEDILSTMAFNAVGADPSATSTIK